MAASTLPTAMAQSCISLRGSTACPAFNQSSISTSIQVRGLFPFLEFVSDTSTFDIQFRQYISTAYSQQKYQQLLGCSNVNLTNTTDLYARYTQTVLCNSIVQNSVTLCGASGDAARPLCAETCAAYATSEQAIASTPDLCGTTSRNAINQIRADFTNCALPSDSLSGACIRGVQNEPNNCGFSGNLPSLCSYCAASSPNSTDSCCLYSQTETRCTGVKLPITTPMGSIFTNGTTGSNSTSSATPAAGTNRGLSGGAIAGIVVGSILGALLLLGLILGCCILYRKRRNSQAGSMLNQPSPMRQGQSAALQVQSHASSTRNQQRDTLPAGARVHQMVALESNSSSHGDHSSPIAGGGYLHSSSGYDDTPESQRSGLGAASLPKRGGSLSGDGSSPRTDGEYSSPDGLASGHSEQMSHFKDYYSQDEIRAGEVVATLWAYQPRANDEWELERGDMLKVVGIWDDGWATGVRLDENAEQWEARRNANRDSGVFNGSSRQILASPGNTESSGEIKAFPLVCVCLPQHWRKTIEGDVADPSASHQPPPSGSP
ncbi:hypothetical protein EJ08DRAFT_668548 [Tothia fuscella]|uniref:SH3 domain-containing protein n=1 Tax=Tothia fuscella TaxID=1048955 RepID=A0A9P4NY89_9PEZI|nr:hypothetical protein EJ08DRAFT_668548 [Tothia fuscella]